MDILSSITSAGATAKPQAAEPGSAPSKKDDELRTAFQGFVAGTFYKQMLKSLRKTTRRPAYFHGGRAEEIFRGQMDQEVSENLAKRPGDTLVGPMYRSFAQRLRPDLAKAIARPRDPATTPLA
jgi:Rod binding domain-containing protein